MTLFDYIDRDGAYDAWIALIEGDVHDGASLLTSGELHGRIKQYLIDKKQHKNYYQHHAAYVGYVIARLCTSDYRTHPSVRALHQLIADTPTYLYTLRLVVKNKEPAIASLLLEHIQSIAKTRPMLFTIKRTDLTDVVADAYRIAWYKQKSCPLARSIISLLQKQLCFTKVQRRNFDKKILKDTGPLNKWYQEARARGENSYSKII